MSARKLGGKPLEQAAPFTKQRQAEQDARLQAERDQIEDAAAARIQLGIILYELPELSFTKEPEPDDGSWWTAYPGRNRWRDSLTDAQILERQYKTVQQVPGYTLADFARDQVGTIERLLEPIRAYYGADDYDLQRGTQYRNFLQAYRPDRERKPKNKGGRHKAYQGTLSQLFIKAGATTEQAEDIIKELKRLAKEKGVPEITNYLAKLYKDYNLKSVRLSEEDPSSAPRACDIRNGMEANGIKNPKSQQTFDDQLSKKLKKL